MVQAIESEPAAAADSRVKQLYDRMAPLYDALNSFYEYSWKRRLRAVRLVAGCLMSVLAPAATCRSTRKDNPLSEST